MGEEGRRAEVANLRPQVVAALEVGGHDMVADQGRRIEGDGLPDLQAFDAVADLVDPPGHLVPQNEGLAQDGRARGPVLPVAEVGSADAAPFHGYAHLPGAGLRVLDLDDAQVAGSEYCYCFHHMASFGSVRSRSVTSGMTSAATSVVPV